MVRRLSGAVAFPPFFYVACNLPFFPYFLRVFVLEFTSNYLPAGAKPSENDRTNPGDCQLNPPLPPLSRPRPGLDPGEYGSVEMIVLSCVLRH